MTNLASRTLRQSTIDPDLMTSGSIPDNFTGTIVGAGYTVWNYDKRGKNSAGHYFFMAYVDLVPDPESGFEPFRQHYTAGGSFTDKKTGVHTMTWFPSQDGATPAGATVEDYQKLANAQVEIEPGTEAQFSGPLCVGFGDTIDKGSNWADFLTKLSLAGQPKPPAGSNRADYMVGCYAKFTRMDPPSRGEGFEGGGKILVATQVIRPGTGQVVAGVAAAPAALTPTVAPVAAAPAPVAVAAAAVPAAVAVAAPVAVAPVAAAGDLDSQLESALFQLVAGGMATLDAKSIVGTLQAQFGPQSPGYNAKHYAEVVNKVLGPDKSWLAGRSMFKFNPANNSFSL